MKKLLLIGVMSLLVLAGFVPRAQAQTVWDGTADISWYDATQTSFDISTPEQLAGVAQLVNSGTSFQGVALNLTADIWLNSTGDSTNNWTPIGGGSPTGESPSNGYAFKGNFNGHGHSIYNLYCDKGSTFHAGLFCALENPCTIDSLVMVNPVLKSRGMMGCIAGFPRGSNSVYVRHCLVINARIVGENTSGSNNIGGIFGATYPNSGSTYIENCGVTGSITGHYPGGIAGNAERSYITNAYFAGDLFAYSTNFGGMTAHGGDRTNCYSYANILSSTSQSSASSHGTSVSQAEMQSPNMIALLGSAFTMDFGINNGYPVMSYMPGVNPAVAEICNGESVTLTAHGLDSYQWNTGANTESITVTPSTTTTYTVTGLYNGTSATLSSTITVYPQAFVTAAIMAGSDGLVHGTVTPDTSYVACMGSDNVTITVTPDAGYRIESVTLNGDEVYGDVFGPGEQTLTINPNGTLGEVKIYLSKCAIVTLPFTEDFEAYASSQVPECYTRISSTTYPYVYSYSSYAHSGSKCIYTYLSSTSNQYMLVLPKMFDMNTYPMENLMVNFWARTSNVNNSVTVGVMSDPTDAGTFTPLQTFTFAATNTYYENTAYFGSAAAGKPYIAFKYNCGSSYTYIYMDDITVDVAPTCSPIINLTVDHIYSTNASLHWQPNTVGETVEYVITVTDASGASYTETTTETDYILGNLSEQTAYTVSVQPDCGGDFGAPVTVSFTTPCAAPVEAVNNSYPTSTYSTEGNHFPMSNHYLNSFTEQIYLPGDFNNVSGEFSGMSFQYNDGQVITRTLDIYMAHTADNEFVQNVWATPLDSYVHVYSGPVTFSTAGTDRWVDIAFDTNFYYNGSDNLLLIVNDITGSEVNNSNPKFYTVNTNANRSQCEYSHDTGLGWGINNMPSTGRLHTQVDNIRLTACDPVSCMAPNTLSVGATDAYSAEISWYNPNVSQSVEVEYKASTDADWTSTGTASGTSYLLAGLDANTQYQVRVRSICGSNDYSEWSEAVAFRTECEAIVTLPYSQNFDTDTYGSGTEAYIYCWDRYTTDPSKPVQMYTTSAAHTTPNALRFYDGVNVTNIAIMPKVDESISLNELQVSFWVRSTSESAPVVLELGVMTDKSDPSTFETLDTIPAPYLPNNEYTLVEYSLADYTGYGQYIAFRASNGNGGNNLRLDDVSLDYIPQCQHPVNLTVSNITSETVDLTWSEVGTASAWYVEYGLAGFTPGEGTVENAYDTAYTLSGLNPNTQYDVYVWSDCSGLESTSISTGFRTDCGPIVALPYTEDFETGIYTTSQDNYILCWNRYASDPAHYVYVPSNTYAHGGTHFLDFHWTSNCYNIAIAPALDQSFDVSQLMVNFWACRTGSSGMLEVGVMTDNEADSTFVPIDTIDLTAMSTYTYAEQFVKFNNYTGDGKYIAFRVSNASSCGFYIDDVTIDYAPACSPVNNLAVSEVTGTTAQVSWTPGYFGTVASYTLEYSEADMENWTTIDNIAEASYLLSGLSFSTNYDLRVKPNCDDLSMGDWTTISFHTQCLTGGDATIGDGTTAYNNLPSNSYYNYSYTQQLFLASEIGGPREMESVTFDMTAHVTDRNYSIYLMHTSATSGADWIDASGAQLVYSGTQATHVGPNTFLFTAPFSYNGSDNLLLVVVDMTGSYTSGNTWKTHTAPFTASRYVYQDGSAYSISSTPSSGTSTSSRNNVVFGAECGTSTCASPVVTVSNITSDGATVTWVAGYQESAWEMEYRPLSDTNWVSMGTVTSMAEVITGLNPNTAYKVRLRSVCDGGEYSTWTEVGFTTACGAISAPWFEDFEGYTSSQLVCWETPVTYTSGSSVFPLVYRNYGEAAHSGGNTIEFKGTDNLLVLPEFTNDIHTLRMSFWATHYGSGTSAQVGVITDLNNPTSFVLLGDAGTPGSRGGNGGGNGNYMGPFDFNGIQAASGRIAIRFTGSGSSAGWNLDDFTVELIPNCPSPVKTSVTVTNITSNEADVTWVDNDPTHNSWTVFYKAANDANWLSATSNQTTTTITGLSSETQYEVYVITNCSVSDSVADATQTVSFTTLVSCPAPASITFSNVTTDAADVSWVSLGSASEWELEYGLHGFAQGSGTMVNALTSQVYTIQNLSPSTQYDVYVRSLCGVGDESAWTGPVSFNTACGPISVATTPWSTGFEGTDDQILNCWVSAATGYRNGHTYPHIEPTSFIAHTGSSALEVAFGSIVTALPLFVEDIDLLQVSFWAYNNHWSVQNAVLELGYMTDPYDSSTFVSLQTLTDQTYTQTTRTFADLAGLNLPTTTRIAFRYIPVNGSSDLTSWYVDDIEVSLATASECDAPTGLAVSNITDNAATATWTTGGSETAWNVQYKTASATNWTDATASTTSYTMSGLTAGTAYQVRVQAICGDGNVSLWTAPVDFTTTGGTTITDPTVTTTAATAVAQTSATLNATITNPDNVTIVTKGFQWKQTAGGTYATVLATGNNFEYNLTGLTAGTGYTYRAFITFSGQTVYGNEMTFTTLEQGVEPCDVPTGLTVASVENHAVTVTWDANPNVNSWNIRYRKANEGSWSSATASTNSYTLSDLDGDTDYEIQVQADCGDGNQSDWTASATAHTTNVGISSWLENSVKVFPNPANDFVNVQCTMYNVQLGADLHVFDVYGKLVQTVPMTGETTILNISTLADGMYFVRVTTEAGAVTKTFVVKR